MPRRVGIDVVDLASSRKVRLMDRVLLARDRLLASSRFQQRAASFPLSRPIARARARQLFDLCAGFVYSQILFACVQLRLFDLLLEAPLEATDIASRCRLSEEAAERLLTAASALGLVERRVGGRYGLGPLGATLAQNASLTQMVEHHAGLYRDLSDPVALLRGAGSETNLSTYWPYAGASDPAGLKAEDVARYSTLMTLSQPLIAAEVLETYAFGAHRVLMDVGGGEGEFLTAAAARFPGLSLRLFDLPAVVERARARVAAQDLPARFEAFGGDFFRDPLPGGADLVSLVRVVLDHPDEKVLALLRNVRSALAEGGTLLIAEALSEPGARDRMGAAYFGFYLLAMGKGRPRSRDEMDSLCRAAGFGSVAFHRGGGVLGTSVLVARA